MTVMDYRQDRGITQIMDTIMDQGLFYGLAMLLGPPLVAAVILLLKTQADEETERMKDNNKKGR